MWMQSDFFEKSYLIKLQEIISLLELGKWNAKEN